MRRASKVGLLKFSLTFFFWPNRKGTDSALYLFQFFFFFFVRGRLYFFASEKRGKSTSHRQTQKASKGDEKAVRG